MKRVIALASLVALAAATVVATSAVATHGKDDKAKAGKAHTRLDGYQEVPSRSTRGHGRFAITEVDRDAKTFKFRLEYSNLEGGNVVGAHLHLAQRHVNGEIVVHICGPTCPASPAVITGTVTNADIGSTSSPPAHQGITKGEATAFEELFRAIRHGAVYVNVHTTNYPGGEIRGQLGPRGFGR